MDRHFEKNLKFTFPTVLKELNTERMFIRNKIRTSEYFLYFYVSNHFKRSRTKVAHWDQNYTKKKELEHALPQALYLIELTGVENHVLHQRNFQALCNKNELFRKSKNFTSP